MFKSNSCTITKPFLYLVQSTLPPRSMPDRRLLQTDVWIRHFVSGYSPLAQPKSALSGFRFSSSSCWLVYGKQTCAYVWFTSTVQLTD